MNIPESMVQDYEMRAGYEKFAGSTIEIHHGIPYVAIEFSNGDSYFFQGEEASELIDSAPCNIDVSDFLLAQAQNW